MASRLVFDEDELGSGGFCRVHRAWREDEDGNQVGETLAIKFLKDEWLSDGDILTRFQREVRLLQDELSHANIIEVRSRNLSADPPWFTMPLMRSSLDRAIAANEVAADEEIQRVFTQVLEAMAYAHSRRIIHRDLKPHNVLLDVDSNVHISDFGLGKDLAGNTGLTKSRMMAGTEAYMAPEQWDDMKGTGPQADVFALGKLLVHLVTRTTPPVGAPDYAKIRDPYLYFIRRCCEPDPAQRYQDAGEALEVFRRLTADPGDPDSQLLRLVDRWYRTAQGPDLEVVARSTSSSSEIAMKKSCTHAASHSYQMRCSSNTSKICQRSLSRHSAYSMDMSVGDCRLTTATQLRTSMGRPGIGCDGSTSWKWWLIGLSRWVRAITVGMCAK